MVSCYARGVLEGGVNTWPLPACGAAAGSSRMSQSHRPAVLFCGQRKPPTAVGLRHLPIPPLHSVRGPCHSHTTTAVLQVRRGAACCCRAHRLTVGAGGVEAFVAQPLGGAVGVELVLAGQAQDLRNGGRRVDREPNIATGAVEWSRSSLWYTWQPGSPPAPARLPGSPC